MKVFGILQRNFATINMYNNAPISNTCPAIDSAINALKEIESIVGRACSDLDFSALENEVSDLCSSVESTFEELRDANGKLREWGERETEKAEEHENKISELESQISDLEIKIDELDSEIYDLNNL